MINPLNHALILPDGHRRYAREKNIPFADAYRMGWSNALSFTKYLLLDEGLSEVTYHAIYSYNFSRTGQDLEDYFDVSLVEIENTAKALHESGIDFYLHGELGVLYKRRPEYKAVIDRLPKPNGRRKRFNLLFAYSAEKELQRAIQALMSEGIALESITYDTLMKKCFSPNPFSLVFTAGQYQYQGQKQSFPFIARVIPNLRNARICATDKFFPAMTLDDVRLGVEEYRKMYAVIMERIAKGQ